MSTTSTAAPPQPRYHPLWQLVLARCAEFYREPEAVFWVYGFPILMVILLGIAFRNKPVEKISVDIQQGPEAEAVATALRQATPEDEQQARHDQQVAAATRHDSKRKSIPTPIAGSDCGPARPI